MLKSTWNVILLCVVLALTGCSAADTVDPAEEPAVTEGAESATSEPDGEPQGTGTLVIAMGNEARTFNTNYIVDHYAFYVDRNIYGRLVARDYESEELFGDLATSWERTDDLMQYTFTLREGVQWHDGEAFDADDVAWTYNDLIETGPEAFAYPHVSTIESVEAVDDYTVVFNMAEPDATLVETLAGYYAPIVLPEHVYNTPDVEPADNPANLAPIGTGPFIFDSQAVGDRIVMTRNPDYYGTVPEFDRLVFRLIPDRATAVAALQQGEVGYSVASPPFGEAESLGEIEGISIATTPGQIIHWIGFNLDNPTLADADVRRAIAMAIDRDELSDQIFFGLAEPAHGRYLSYNAMFNPEALQPEYNVEEANRLLDEAGHPRGDDGMRFTLRYLVWRSSIFGGPEIAEVAKQRLLDVGIGVEIELNDFAVFNEMVTINRDFDITAKGGVWGPNPQTLSSFSASWGADNQMNYNNPRVDELFEVARQSADPDDQRDAYFEIQEILAEDMPTINFIEYAYLRPYRSELSGFWWEEGSGELLVSQDMYNAVTGVSG